VGIGLKYLSGIINNMPMISSIIGLLINNMETLIVIGVLAILYGACAKEAYKW
jgi:hypothetical protein